MPQLTARQAQIVERVARGLPNKQIARDLGLSVRTVENHIRELATRIPDPPHATPRHRLTLFFLQIDFSAEP